VRVRRGGGRMGEYKEEKKENEKKRKEEFNWTKKE
jgi:hypothetical protein